MSPFERIKKLEEIVRSLGGDPASENGERPTPEKGERPSSTVLLSSGEGDHVQTPIIVRQEGRPVYHES